jgi:Fe-S cluster assembly protein SufD
MSSTLAERMLAALPEPVDAAAALARQRFAENGLPSAKVESWRYSSLRGMQTLNPEAGFSEALGTPEMAGVSATLATLAGGQVLIAAEPPAGISISAQIGPPAAGAISRRDADVSAGRDSAPPRPESQQPGRAFQWLNQAGAGAGFQIEVMAALPGIWRLAMQHDSHGLMQLRARVLVRQNASICLMEHWFGSDEATGLSNVCLEIDLEPGARLTLIRLQELGARAQSVQRTELRCGAGASVALVNLELGALWSRHDLQLHLDAAGASVAITGLVALQGRQHHDTQLALTHAQAGASSKTLWKAVANGRSRSVFDGLITVMPGADQTEAHLKTANLLLSAHAEIDTKPELVIEADEVVCSHGATVGQLDDKALFYLRSRGIPETQARQMLTLAFGGEVLSAVECLELRATLAERVDVHLPQQSAA